MSSSSTTAPVDPATLPTIPSSWTAPTSCFATTNYYRALLGGGYFSNLYGTPTPVLTGNAPTGSCFPPSFTIDVPYRTDGDCPTGYTRACATGGTAKDGASISTVTCCPSVTSNAFSFMCRNHEYGCHATATAGAVWTGVITDLSAQTEQPVTRTPSTAEGLEAWGIKFIEVSPASNAASSTTSGSSSSDTASAGASSNSPTPGSTGLAPGAIAGIAIGVVAVVAFLGLAAFLLFRRRKRAAPPNAAAGGYVPPPSGGYSDVQHPQDPNTLYAQNMQKERYQLDTEPERYQLDGTSAPLAHTKHNPAPDAPRWELEGS